MLQTDFLIMHGIEIGILSTHQVVDRIEHLLFWKLDGVDCPTHRVPTIGSGMVINVRIQWPCVQGQVVSAISGRH
jgi:hypothetical protein